MKLLGQRLMARDFDRQVAEVQAPQVRQKIRQAIESIMAGNAIL